MVRVTSMLPAVLLCVALLAPSPVQAVSITKWFSIIINIFRTIFYHFMPSKRSQIQAIDNSLSELTEILNDIMPERAPLRNYEKSKSYAYVCLGEGYAGNFQTLRKFGKIKHEWQSDNSVKVKIPYKVDDFKVGYGIVYISMLGKVKKRGSLDVSLGKNKLVFGLQIPNVLSMLDLMSSGGECFINITSFDVPKLMGAKVNFHTDGLTHGVATTGLLNHYLSGEQPFLKKAVRERFLGNIYLKLAKKTKTICIDPPLLEEMKKLGLLEERVYSDEFAKHCGNNKGEQKNKEKNTNIEEDSEEDSDDEKKKNTANQKKDETRRFHFRMPWKKSTKDEKKEPEERTVQIESE